MRVAVITGASSGIGQEFAKQIDKEGKVEELWLIARREERLKGLEERLQTRVKILKIDLEEIEGLRRYREELEAEVPDVKYLVNAAGIGKLGNYNEITLEESIQMVNLNIRALMVITLETLDYMGAGGKIIEMGSTSGFQPLPGFNIYASTKAFVRNYTRALHKEVREKGIIATVVSPGWVDTEFLEHMNLGKVEHAPKKLKRVVTVEEVVSRALKDSERGKMESIYGLYNKTHFILSKVLPKRALAWAWLREQRKGGRDDKG